MKQTKVADPLAEFEWLLLYIVSIFLEILVESELGDYCSAKMPLGCKTACLYQIKTEHLKLNWIFAFLNIQNCHQNI